MNRNDCPERTLSPIGGLLLALALAIGLPAHAADIPVDTLNDEVLEDDHCSLREAVLSANQDVAIGGCVAGAGPDRVLLQAGAFYVLTIPSAGEDQAYTGDLDVTDDLTVVAVGNLMHAVIDQSADDRVFHLIGSEQEIDRPTIQVEFENLLLQGGHEATGGGIEAHRAIANLRGTTVANNVADQRGGGIHADGFSHVRLYSSVLSQNEVPGSLSGNGGGGIWLDAGSGLYLKRSDVTDNRAERSGGGIYLSEGAGGQAHQSRIRGNEAGGALAGGANGAGGGIANEGSFLLFESEVALNHAGVLDGDELVTDGGGGGIWNSGSLSVERSLVAENVASEFGGGIRQMVGAHLFFSTSTLSGNHAGENGGGLWLASQGNGECTNVFESDFLLHATVVQNTTPGTAPGVHVQPSGFLCFGNTVVADGCGPMGTKDAHGPNLDVGGDCDFGAGSFANTGLDPLADNGGYTRTHMPAAGSDIVDGGSNSLCAQQDQRGAFRPTHPLGDPSDVCDVGAVESDGRLWRFEPVPPGLPWSPGSDDEERSTKGEEPLDPKHTGR